MQRFPIGHCPLPLFAFRGILAPFHIVERDLIGSHKTASCTHLDGQVAQRQASLHCEFSNGLSGIFNKIARGTRRRQLGHEEQGYILCRDTPLQRTIDGDTHGLGLLLQDALRSHDHLHLCRTYAKCNGTNGTVRTGVRVAADNSHARKRESFLGTYDMDNAIIGCIHGEMSQPELLAISCQ